MFYLFIKWGILIKFKSNIKFILYNICIISNDAFGFKYMYVYYN